MFTRPESNADHGAGINGILLQARYDNMSLFPICSSNSDTDLMNLWIPTLETCRDVHVLSEYRRVLEIVAKVPWPLDNR